MFWNKRKSLSKKLVQLSQDWLGLQHAYGGHFFVFAMLPFSCVKTLLKKKCLVTTTSVAHTVFQLCMMLEFKTLTYQYLLLIAPKALISLSKGIYNNRGLMTLS